MKIKNLGYLSLSFSFDNLDLITDPLALRGVGINLPKMKTDAVICTHDLSEEDFEELDSKYSSSRRDNVFYIDSPGEYELGGLMVRRNIGSNFYILDEEDLRVLYIGYISKDVNVDEFKNLGDVDVLVLPVGDGENFPEFSDVEKIIHKVAPLLLIPTGYKQDSMKKSGNLKTVEEFIKQAGYTNVKYENSVNVSSTAEKDVRQMDVVILE